MSSTLFPLRKLPEKQRSIDEQIEDAKLPHPVTEYFFAKRIWRQWRFDYCWPDYRIALEIEGLAFGRIVETKDGDKVRTAGGRHATGAGMQADCEKYSWAAILGWLVIRATTQMVRRGEAIELLKQAFAVVQTKGRQ
jgi:very-short-patch-repair endonuclease